MRSKFNGRRKLERRRVGRSTFTRRTPHTPPPHPSSPATPPAGGGATVPGTLNYTISGYLFTTTTDHRFLHPLSISAPLHLLRHPLQRSSAAEVGGDPATTAAALFTGAKLHRGDRQRLSTTTATANDVHSQRLDRRKRTTQSAVGRERRRGRRRRQP